MGEQAIKLLGGKGKVAFITSLGATNLQRRLDGVKEALAKAPGIKIVETYDIKEDVIRCAEIIATGTRPLSDLGGVDLGRRLAGVHAQRAGAPLTREDQSDLVRHGQPGARSAREGKVQVLLGQKYFGWGSESVKLLRDIKQGKKPASPIIDSGVDVVTKDNVDAYEQQWKKMAGQIRCDDEDFPERNFSSWSQADRRGSSRRASRRRSSSPSRIRRNRCRSPRFG